MPDVAPLWDLALLLALSLFFGFAFEEFHARTTLQRPGGVRTFPLLALFGALLYLLDRERLIALVAGLVVLGAWLAIAYHQQFQGKAAEDRFTVELIAPLCNMLAYLIGPVTLAMPHWIAVGVTVAAVLLLTAREPLHQLAQRVEMNEITTAAKFLILSGIVLPLLPDEPVTSLTAITPYKAWLALLAVCTLSYASYLVQRFLVPSGGALVVALLGGLYSSTATTVVLARAAAAAPQSAASVQAGIMLATSVMYLRILVIVAVFSLDLARVLAPVAVGLFVVGVLLAFLQNRAAPDAGHVAAANPQPPNPLELRSAIAFAVLFIAISIATQWARSQFGAAGLNLLAVAIGFTDIDPFVLSLAQGGSGTLSAGAAASAILIATASNNVLKASYAVAFAGWRVSMNAAAMLVALAAAAVAVALFL